MSIFASTLWIDIVHQGPRADQCCSTVEQRRIPSFIEAENNRLRKPIPGEYNFISFPGKRPWKSARPAEQDKRRKGGGAARDIDRKLWVTATLLGAVTCKGLAAAFRRVNPMTSFDVERAHKWIQGPARPREFRLYEDWARVLDLQRSGARIAGCEPEEFIEVVCARHNCDRDMLERQLESSRRPAAEQRRESSLSLTGTARGRWHRAA